MPAETFFEMLIGNPFDVVIWVYIVKGFPIRKWIKTLSPKIVWDYSFSISIQRQKRKAKHENLHTYIDIIPHSKRVQCA